MRFAVAAEQRQEHGLTGDHACRRIKNVIGNGRRRLAEKKRKASLAESLAYLGSKYKTDELMPTWMHTEVGIYEAYVMTDRKLLDETVFSSIETLIGQMRAGRCRRSPIRMKSIMKLGGKKTC